MSEGFVLHNVDLQGARQDVRIENGVITDIGRFSSHNTDSLDAQGGALLPGLIDHHIHLFAAAAREASFDASSIHNKQDLIAALREACSRLPPGEWLRAIGYDDSRMGLLSRDDLDQCGVSNPIRLKDRTGALWVLNSHALEKTVSANPPDMVERDDAGRLTGRIWRGDAWLRTRINASPPSLSDLSKRLASYGVTGVTDAGAHNGPQEAGLLADARARGDLCQRLCVMSAGEIPPSPYYETGPLKILFDERAAPEVDEIVAHMKLARALDRCTAVHCVTVAELMLTIAAFETIGARHGDRIEHGGMIPEPLISVIRAHGLTIVSQPGFIYERGDRYLRTIPADEMADLYRLNSLINGGVLLAAGSDAPYGGLDPWRAIQAATDRLTRENRHIGLQERLGAHLALGLYMGRFDDPSAQRRISTGAAADLCLLADPLADTLCAPASARVIATFVGGAPIFISA